MATMAHTKPEAAARERLRAPLVINLNFYDSMDEERLRYTYTHTQETLQRPRTHCAQRSCHPCIFFQPPTTLTPTYECCTPTTQRKRARALDGQPRRGPHTRARTRSHI